MSNPTTFTAEAIQRGARYAFLDAMKRETAMRRRLARESGHAWARYEAGAKALGLIELVQRLCLAGAPMTTAELAEDMGLSRRTVQRYIRIIRDLTTLDLVEIWDVADKVTRFRIRGLVRESRQEPTQ